MSRPAGRPYSTPNPTEPYQGALSPQVTGETVSTISPQITGYDQRQKQPVVPRLPLTQRPLTLSESPVLDIYSSPNLGFQNTPFPQNSFSALPPRPPPSPSPPSPSISPPPRPSPPVSPVSAYATPARTQYGVIPPPAAYMPKPTPQPSPPAPPPQPPLQLQQLYDPEKGLSALKTNTGSTFASTTKGNRTVVILGRRYSRTSVIVVSAVVVLIVLICIGLGAGLGAKGSKHKNSSDSFNPLSNGDTNVNPIFPGNHTGPVTRPGTGDPGTKTDPGSDTNNNTKQDTDNVCTQENHDTGDRCHERTRSDDDYSDDDLKKTGQR